MLNVMRIHACCVCSLAPGRTHNCSSLAHTACECPRERPLGRAVLWASSSSWFHVRPRSPTWQSYIYKQTNETMRTQHTNSMMSHCSSSSSSSVYSHVPIACCDCSNVNLRLLRFDAQQRISTRCAAHPPGSGLQFRIWS